METAKRLKFLLLLIFGIFLIGIIQADENLAINCAGDENLGISCLSSEELGTFYGKIPSGVTPGGGGAGGPSIPQNETIIKPTEEKKIDWLTIFLIAGVIILFLSILFRKKCKKFWFIFFKKKEEEEKEKK